MHAPELVSRFRERIPLITASVVFAALVWWLYVQAVSRTHGHLTYVLDDAYIHLAIAKNIVFHSTWGISADAWSGASSSLLWTTLLSGLFALIGDQEYIPFVLNALFSVGVLWMLDRIWQRIGLSWLWRLLLLLASFLFLPLATEPFIGMEVALQCFVLLLFYEALTRTRPASTLWLFVVSFLLGAARYETILIVELVGIGLLLRGERRRAAAVAVGGALPALIYGVLALSYGGTFVPNTLLLKAKGLQSISALLLRHTIEAWSFGILACALGVYFIRRQRRSGSQLRLPIEAIVLGTTITTALAQGTLSNAPEQFERYTSYIYLSLLLCIGIGIAYVMRRSERVAKLRYLRLSAPIVVVALSLLLAPRFVFYLHQVPLASKNIYDEQVQTGRFLRMAYRDQPVAVFDIGAPSYFGDARLIDLIGLGSDDVAHARLYEGDRSDILNAIVERHHARLAVLYPYQNYTPQRDWVLAGTLMIDSNVICASDSVQFYATQPADTTWLRTSLATFRDRSGVKIVLR